MSRQTLSSLLFAGAIVFLILALATLIPYSSPMVSDLGYHTFCPFAPYSTLTLLFLAGLGWVVRRHIDALQRQ
jgi:hypothetical protein